MWRWLLVLCSLVSCVACAPVISREVRAQVAPHLTYTDIAANPAAYVGTVVLVAGTIVEARNFQHGTRLELLQYPADGRGRPRTNAPTGGRFLVWAPEYLETAIYRPGREITVAGEVTEPQELPLGDTTYRYPVLVPREVYLWPGGASSPAVRIGIGFGFGTRF
jgi:outer membrane lipoprotein